MPVYLSMLGILNLADKLATGIPSRSSQAVELSDTSTIWYGAQYGPCMCEYPQGLWYVLLQVGQPQNDHVIDKGAYDIVGIGGGGDGGGNES